MLWTIVTRTSIGSMFALLGNVRSVCVCVCVCVDIHDIPEKGKCIAHTVRFIFSLRVGTFEL